MTIDQSNAKPVKHSPLHIVGINPLSDSRWETLMNQLPDSNIYQHPAWLKVLEEAYGYKPLHLACEDATGALRGVLPLFYRRGLRTGRLCFSTTPEAGPLSDDEQARTMLIQAAIERSRAERATAFHFANRSTIFNNCVDDVVGIPDDETYELDLPEHPDLLRLNKVKRAVNKATRLGVQVRPAETTRELREWYSLYLETTRRLVILPQPYKIFETAWRLLRPQGLLQLHLAEQVEAGHRRIIAGFVYLQWKHRMTYLIAGWRWDDQALRPNDLLHWHSIHQACAQGLRWYDFGAVNTGNQGLAQFKTKWGAVTKTIYSYSYPIGSRGRTDVIKDVSDQSNASESESAQSDSPKRSIRQLALPLWHRLPLKAIEWVGEWRRTIHYY